MNPDFPDRVTDKIEALCESGCTQINQLLDKASQGNEIEELEGFSESERLQVITELEKIMAVYVSNDT